MTVSASIPAAVISMGIIRRILHHDSILENNMVQTIGSAGESLAAGAIFTLPALFMWAKESDQVTPPSFLTITLLALAGGILGTLFMVPLRTALIVEEHGVLPFPEGTACAEVLLAGEEGGEKSKVVFSGLGISAVYKFLADGLILFPSEVHWDLPALNTGFGMDVLPALAGVGFICGQPISNYTFAGGLLGWFVLIPLLSLFGGDSIIAPGTDPIASLGAFGVWKAYVRYIGAGALATGGIISLVKSPPTIVNTFRKAVAGFGHSEESALRTNRDLPMSVVLGGTLAITVLIWLIPSIPISLMGALLVAVFGFFFATVSSRMVGLVGSSNNPVSGMSIACLLVTASILKATGNSGIGGMVSSIAVGTIVCIVAAMAGDTSQDLKTGYIVGATPIRQQIGELLGAVAAGTAIAGIVYLLNTAWGFGSTKLPAPQATLMKLVVEGVMGGTLPWNLVFCGVGVALLVEILGLPVLPVAIGVYLPIHLSAPIFLGGLIRALLERRGAGKDAVEMGVLYSSGLIAGEGLVGILLAVFAVLHITERIAMSAPLGNWGGTAFFAVLLLSMVWFSLKGSKAQKNG
jgi:putative OPT family oligopeptide transporter